MQNIIIITHFRKKMYSIVNRRGLVNHDLNNHRVLSSQFELIDSQRFGIFQLLYILHLFIVASELLRDQDLNAPADNRAGAKLTNEKRSKDLKCISCLCWFTMQKTHERLWLVQKVNPNKTSARQKRGMGERNDSHCGLWNIMYAKQGVVDIRWAQDARCKNDCERVWRHFIVSLLLCNSGWMNTMQVETFKSSTHHWLFAHKTLGVSGSLLTWRGERWVFLTCCS